MRVRMVNIRHGNPAQGRGNFLYAELRNADTNDLIISADPDYILAAVKDRGYILIGDKK